jgi:DNA-binding MarR family transcriptional regulator
MKKKDIDIRSVMDSLRRIVRAVRLSAQDTDRRLGISVAQLFVLQELSDGSAHSIGELAAATHTDSSSVSVVVRRLLERGLVVRGTSAHDTRRAAISLTDEGRAVLARAPKAPQSELVGALSSLSDARRRQLAKTLAEVARSLGHVAPTFFFEDEE